MSIERENRRMRWPGLAGALDTVAALLPRRLPEASHEDLLPEDLCDAGMRVRDIGGRRVAYTDHGSGREALIMVHGFAGSHRTWSALQVLLGERHRVICPDLWGFGGSGRPATLAPHDWTDQLLGLMDALGITDAALVGHSIGGRVALTCAATAGHRVRGVALLGSDGAQMLSRYPFLWAMARTPLLRMTVARLAVSGADVRRLLRASYSEHVPITETMITAYQRPL
ncbi:MAG TPA: alpha/beta fold hydrolase, partial [Armatimonadota bacterium]|nr:alpha/beta fold hydrolase [Armatimonadota bacterium]